MSKKKLLGLLSQCKKATREYPYALKQTTRDGFRLAILLKNNQNLLKEISKNEHAD